MKYRDMNTGNLYTIDEIEELFDQFRWEMEKHYDSFEEYLDDMIQKDNFRKIDDDYIRKFIEATDDGTFESDDALADFVIDALYDEFGDTTDIVAQVMEERRQI